MNDECYEQSCFMKWCLEHPGPYTLSEEIELRKEAMAALVDSVKAGDITSLDGVGVAALRAHSRSTWSDGLRNEQQLGRIVAGLDLPVLRPFQASGYLLAKIYRHIGYFWEVDGATKLQKFCFVTVPSIAALYFHVTLAAQLLDGHAGLGLLDEANDLFFGESALIHVRHSWLMTLPSRSPTWLLN